MRQHTYAGILTIGYMFFLTCSTDFALGGVHYSVLVNILMWFISSL